MRFFVFIEAHQNQILDEWDKFAATMFAKNVQRHLVRDHAAEMLDELTADMQTDQTDQDQVRKSKGRSTVFHPADSAANAHGVSRSNDGMTVFQLASEFRSLRAIIMRLWLPKIDDLSLEVITDIVRFNEAIDEALADSITSHSEDRA